MGLSKEDIKIRDTCKEKPKGDTMMSQNGLQVNGIVKFEIVNKIVARDSNSCRELIFTGVDGQTITLKDM